MMKRLALVPVVVSFIGVAALAAAPVGRYIIGNEIVTDKVTGLVWQRVVSSSSYNWATAKTYCDGLTLAGSSAWRLPTVIELESLVDSRSRNPSIDTTAFPNTPSDWFWSSTESAGQSSWGWFVSFENGNAFSFSTDGSSDDYHRVRCVR